MRELKRMLVCMGLMVLMLATVAARAQTIDALDPALQSRVDRIAAQVLEQTGVPSASVAVVKGGKLVYTHAYGKARLATGNGSRRRRHAGDALFHRVDLQAVYRRGDSAVAGGGQALAGRCGGQVRSRSDARRRGDHPADSLAHLRLSGLLAGGLRDDHHDCTTRPRSRSSTRGAKSRWTLSRERSGSIRTPTSSLRGASWSRLRARRTWSF